MGVIYPFQSKHRVTNPVLDGVLSGLANAPGAYIADALMQPVQAPREGSGDNLRVQTSGTIFTVDSSAFFGVAELDDVWPSKASPNEVPGAQLGNTTYSTKRRGLKVTSDNEMEIESEAPVPISMLDLKQTVEALRIKKEVRRKTLFFTTGNWTTSSTLTGGDQWTDSSGNPQVSADPIGQMRDRIEALADYGVEANAAIFGRPALRGLRKHPAILDLLPMTERRIGLTPQRLKQILSEELEIPLEGIHFGVARYNTAHTGGTVSLSDVWGDSCWFGRLLQKPMASPAAAGTGDLVVEATAAVVVEAYGMSFYQYDDDDKDAKINRVAYRDDAVVVQAQAGTVLADTQAA